jgi:hypothetical protein
MTRYPLYRKLGRPQGQSEQVLKISPPTGIRTPDRLYGKKNKISADQLIQIPNFNSSLETASFIIRYKYPFWPSGRSRVWNLARIPAIIRWTWTPQTRPQHRCVFSIHNIPFFYVIHVINNIQPLHRNLLLYRSESLINIWHSKETECEGKEACYCMHMTSWSIFESPCITDAIHT